MFNYTIFCPFAGIMGTANYRTYEEAQAAADWRTNCTGVEWIVKELQARR